jgi:hypothetical protein
MDPMGKSQVFFFIIWHLRVTHLLHLWRQRHPGAASARRGLRKRNLETSIFATKKLQHQISYYGKSPFLMGKFTSHQLK